MADSGPLRGVSIGTILPVLGDVPDTTVLFDFGLPQAATLTIGWIVVALVVGGTLIVGFRSSTRAISDDVASRPDLTFAVGFAIFFGLLAVVSVSFLATTVVEHPAVLAIGALVALLGLVLWGALLVVGGAYGVVAAGDRITTGLGDESPSLFRSLVVGTAVLGSSQLVPILGALVTMVIATLGTGAGARRWTGAGGVEGRILFAGETDEADPTRGDGNPPLEGREREEDAGRGSSD